MKRKGRRKVREGDWRRRRKEMWILGTRTS
jgi:hypothetical protein